MIEKTEIINSVLKIDSQDIYIALPKLKLTKTIEFVNILQILYE